MVYMHKCMLIESAEVMCSCMLLVHTHKRSFTYMYVNNAIWMHIHVYNRAMKYTCTCVHTCKSFFTCMYTCVSRSELQCRIVCGLCNSSQTYLSVSDHESSIVPVLQFYISTNIHLPRYTAPLCVFVVPINWILMDSPCQ